ncbi:MAG: hypothetical protein LBT34_03375 [Clostridiales Family XIII bacterium]|jgi:hypothetical protein|nr:hypothetical protein [Clostridiales Family XIII bacterium]
MFGRIDKEGGMSLWRATSDGSGLAKLADLHANAYVPFEQPVTSETGEGPEPDYSGYPTAYEDFYGRGSWYDMLAVR